MARARDINDVVRLLASKQLDTALMREEDAVCDSEARSICR